jgi:hypothetical protein
MRNVSTIASAGLITGALLLSACSTSGTSGAGSAMPQAASQGRTGTAIANAKGIDTRYTGAYQTLQARLSPDKAKVDKDLFVSDGGSTVYLFANKTYKPDGTITDGVSDNDGLWVDKAGNLYVANVSPKNVTEYAPGSTSPTCTYSTGLVDPINETTDAKGNVYIVDFNNFNTPGFVDEFKQCGKKVVQQYSVSSGPEGVAIDSKGNLFVSFFNTNFNGAFEEFPAGKTTGTVLAATVGSPGGLAIDKKGDLIADDQTGAIDVIAPPYSSATPLVSGLSDPFHVALSKNEKLLFNANTGNGGTITIYSYPSGKLTKTLDTSNGFGAVEGVVDSPNATF